MFDDPLMAHRPDLNSDEERWLTIGLMDNVVVIMAHTWPVAAHGTGVEVARIISAWKATAHERRPMKKVTSRELTKEQKTEIEALADLPDEKIDTSDIPEILDWSSAERGTENDRFHKRHVPLADMLHEEHPDKWNAKG